MASHRSKDMISKIESAYTCSLESTNVEEPLFGTMSKSSIWILLEYPFSWGAKALKNSKIPQPVKERLSSMVDSSPEVRLQLIKKPKSNLTGQITIYVAIPRESQPILYKFLLAKYDDILNVDFTAIFSGEQVYQDRIQKEPIYLVCTNGKRDPCCAKFGIPVFTSLRRMGGDKVWQTTHVGGHRFAANVLCFPHGILYGRVAREDVQPIVDSFQSGKIYLEKYRGRACYNEVVHAAEYYLRNKTNNNGISAFHLQGVEEKAENQWSVQFLKSEDNAQYRIQISASLSNYQIYLSCKDTEKKSVTIYHLDQFQVNDQQTTTHTN